MKRKKKNIFIITFLIFLGLVYIIFTGIKKTSVYYFTFEEFYKRKERIGSKIVRISGNVLPKSISFNEGIASFLIGNEKENIKVIYRGPLPDLIYQDSAKVVIEGSYNPFENTFDATFLMTQCPSKYRKKLK
ncbi:MAG: cytochrome c maturation protein CcmE [candidate division WOR-3 bacterium]